MNSIDPRTVLSHARQAPAATGKKPLNQQALRKSCQEFEAIYVMEMVKAMRKAVPDGGLLPKSMASETYQEMLDQENIRQATAAHGLGIGEAMYQQLSRQLDLKK